MAQDKSPDKTVETLSFEQAIDALKAVVDRIEDGQVPLEESIAQYERGMALIQHCRSILQRAEQRIETIHAEQAEPEAEA